MKVILFATGLTVLVFASCGGGSIVINDPGFQPKIVIQETLFPQQPVNNIRIMRNFPIGASINSDAIILPNANARIVDANGRSFGLIYNSETAFYEYRGSDLRIEHGEPYTLEVTATIDGKELSARSTTTVPLPGFRILAEQSVLGPMVYRARDENGELIDLTIAFERSPGTNFYAVSLTALDADVSTFIYDNPFGEFDEDHVLDDFSDFKYAFNWIQDTPTEAGVSSIEIFSFFTWFFGEYQAVVYAADRNFKDFLLTHEEVQEIDGNFHEPALHIEGDGIGVFGSAIADTVRFRVLRE